MVRNLQRNITLNLSGEPMDAISPSVIVRLAAKGVIGAVGASRAASQKAQVRRLVKGLEAADSDATRFVIPAIGELQDMLTGPELDKVCRFLNSPEADVFIRSLAISILTREYDHSEADLKDELSSLVVLSQGLSPRASRRVTPKLFSIFTDATLRVAGEFRNRVPQEYGKLVDRAMYEKNAGYLRTLVERTRLFRTRTSRELVDIREFVARYKAQLRAYSAELVPAYYDTQRRVELSAIYVDPRFSYVDNTRRKSASATFSLMDLVRSTYRIVVLGDPGAGKSTLARKIAYEYSATSEKTMRA